ncbi:hypothetical protein FM107_06415 [Sphingobacterium sp. JB170]|nr:hypothetical protein FM107_06415 [Sphingobacterium sp. JB170]
MNNNFRCTKIRSEIENGIINEQYNIIGKPLANSYHYICFIIKI